MVQAAIATRHLAEDNLVVTSKKMATSDKNLIGFPHLLGVATRLSSAECRAATAHEGTLLTACNMLPARETLRHLSITASE